MITTKQKTLVQKHYLMITTEQKTKNVSTKTLFNDYHKTKTKNVSTKTLFNDYHKTKNKKR